MKKLSINNTSEIEQGYLAADGYIKQLKEELGVVDATYDRLLLSPKIITANWAQNIWLNPEIIKFSSISDAAKKLKSIQRNWALYSYQLHRRANLIAEQLPHVSAKPLSFPCRLPTSPLGSWTLLDNETILASAKCSSMFPNGEIYFIENKTEAPSRAYLKLWEIFTLTQNYPKAKDKCLDLGASPGGWTWVLAELGASVTSVDRSELHPSLMKKKNIQFIKGDFNSLTPDKSESYDWVFSDVICYPDKLFNWAKNWVESKKAKNIICTIKFQGSNYYKEIKNFEAIKNSKILHLFNNKHELTWVYSSF